MRKQALGLSPEPVPLASERLLNHRARSEMPGLDPGDPLWDLRQAELRSRGHVPVALLTSCGVLGQPPASFGSLESGTEENPCLSERACDKDDRCVPNVCYTHPKCLERIIAFSFHSKPMKQDCLPINR